MSVETIDLTPPTPPTGTASVDLTPGTAPGAPATIDASAHSLDDDNAALIISIPAGGTYSADSNIQVSSPDDLPFVYVGSLDVQISPPNGGGGLQLLLPANADLNRATMSPAGAPVDNLTTIKLTGSDDGDHGVMADGSLAANLTRLLPDKSGASPSPEIVTSAANKAALETSSELVAAMAARNWSIVTA